MKKSSAKDMVFPQNPRGVWKNLKRINIREAFENKNESLPSTSSVRQMWRNMDKEAEKEKKLENKKTKTRDNNNENNEPGNKKKHK